MYFVSDGSRHLFPFFSATLLIMLFVYNGILWEKTLRLYFKCIFLLTLFYLRHCISPLSHVQRFRMSLRKAQVATVIWRKTKVLKLRTLENL